MGRGGKRGTYSGKGIKGQKSRAGTSSEPIVRGLIKRYPKLRGYRFSGNDKNIAILNLTDLEKNFNDGDKVTPSVIANKRMIRNIKGRVAGVKILGNGELTKKLVIEDCSLSKKAEESIKKAGGEICGTKK